MQLSYVTITNVKDPSIQLNLSLSADESQFQNKMSNLHFHVKMKRKTNI